MGEGFLRQLFFWHQNIWKLILLIQFHGGLSVFNNIHEFFAVFTKCFHYDIQQPNATTFTAFLFLKMA
ncbi:hypothetical protein OROGR_027550 [Orobanche gracilis]